MFVLKQFLVTILVFVSFGSYSSKSIRDDQYFGLFVVNAKQAPAVTQAPEAAETTYDWGQWTKTQAPGSGSTYDWGQHTGSGSTYDWGQHTGSTEQPGSQTTYDWGQHTATGTTYNWGQHTGSTQAPGSRTTYDWGQHTATGTTYNWGQHTGSTQSPGSRTTYDWGQHTATGTTYNWGQHTGSTVNPDDNSTVTENPNEYRCAAGKYTCKGTIGLCISLSQICDGKQDCPHRDDENPKTCFPLFGGNKNKYRNVNSFSGTGFQFHVRNVVIRSGSEAKLFNQQSDNRNTHLIQTKNQQK